MCGISGIWLRDGGLVDPHDLHRMNETLAHRGPDGRGIYLEGGLGLSHTRLAILDTTEAGHQPMHYENQRYWLTYNGEIYNFLELRAELETKGYRFSSNTDSEVVLAAYAEWGEDCQFHFNGMWAFAIWDSHEKVLFLSRDRFGVKPLYYWTDGINLTFGSELKTFLALNFIPIDFDADPVGIALTNPAITESIEETMIRNVRRLLPGHCIRITHGHGINQRRWWNTLDHLPPRIDGYENNSETICDLFMDACNIRLRSDVPVGTALSGGLDSSLVHCAIAELNKKGSAGIRYPGDWQKAFHASCHGTHQDESSFAEDVVCHTGTECIFTQIEPAQIMAFSDEVIYASESISDNLGALWLTYRAMRQNGVVVSLDGHGADEIYAGYHHQTARAAELVDNPSLEAMYNETLKEMTVPGREAYNGMPGTDSTAFIKILLKTPRLANRQSDVERLREFDPITQQLYLDFHYQTLPVILRNFDRTSMAHGVEIRAPFLDWRLVCHAFSIPIEYKIANGYSKYILREALGSLLPDSVRTRKSKLGFVTPVPEWSNEDLINYVRDMMASQYFLKSPFWNGPMIQMVAEKYLAFNEKRVINWLWMFLQAARMMELFTSKAKEIRSL